MLSEVAAPLYGGRESPFPTFSQIPVCPSFILSTTGCERHLPVALTYTFLRIRDAERPFYGHGPSDVATVLWAFRRGQQQDESPVGSSSQRAGLECKSTHRTGNPWPKAVCA